ncbi:bifunctional phosphoribosyl-AMP cyclohydrolase/phosphoribosyl-ATP diphosphatase HisIE [Blattabacterium cuenoti]|uniref:bifunctional phosphoribosyl-AMP cyclohydrolase/phosphoribosyl-ATP diphosphatase HisIE n=1 Tax=Blattabacterium cuenoti TaxID=1653831 RepID=UPI00163C941D|nr:bifunctional phosphoribosyl-AMP cyclohydrolase/phosphoribosyl-ATP diphosphatase HisIE [Blattabacterium cuenoti]
MNQNGKHFLIKEKIDFKNQLIPVIIQDINTNKVLMLGYMNENAYKKSIHEKIVTFYSRSKNRLWTKGETSKNFLFIQEILIDCDQDTLLIKVKPNGPTCHKGLDTCWKERNKCNFLFYLESLISKKYHEKNKNSYIYQLLKKGINRIIQKLGEESIEMIIESKDHDKNLFLNESADLLFHYLIILYYKKTSIQEVINVLEKRHMKKDDVS